MIPTLEPDGPGLDPLNLRNGESIFVSQMMRARPMPRHKGDAIKLETVAFTWQASGHNTFTRRINSR